MLTIKRGDVFKELEPGDVFVHGANCFNVMGAGVAAAVSRIFPKAAWADMQTRRGDRAKLGSFSYAVTKEVTVVNMYSQFAPGPNFDINAFDDGLGSITQKFGVEKRYVMPAIGAGIGGGDIKEILGVIEEFKDYTIIMVIYDDALWDTIQSVRDVV